MICLFIAAACTAVSYASAPPKEVTVALIWHEDTYASAGMFQMLVDEANADPDLFPNTTVRPVVVDAGTTQAERIEAIRGMYQRHSACLSYGLGADQTGELMGTMAKAYNSNHGFVSDIFLSSMPLYVDVGNTFAFDGVSSMVPSMLDIAESFHPPVKRWGLILTTATQPFYDGFVAQQKARGTHTAFQVIQTNDLWSKTANRYLTDQQVLQNARNIIDAVVESKVNVFFMCFCMITNVAYKAEFLRYANSRGLFAKGYQWYTFNGAMIKFIEDFIYKEEYMDLWGPLTHFKILDVTDFEPSSMNYSYYREAEISELSFASQLAKLQLVIDRYDPSGVVPGNGWSSLSWLNCSLPRHARLKFCDPEYRPSPISRGSAPHLDGVRQGLRTLHSIIYEQGHNDFCDFDVYGNRKGDPNVFTQELVSKPFDGVTGNRRFVEMPVTGGSVPSLWRTWHVVDFRPYNVGVCESGCGARFRSAGPTEMHTNPTAPLDAPISERVLHRNFETAAATDYASIGWMGNTTMSPRDWFHGMCGPSAYINLTSVKKECVACPAGLFNAPDDDVDECVPIEAFECPRGMELAPALAMSGIPCRNCTIGFFEIRSRCERCPEGQYQSMPGSSACTSCPAGRATRYMGAQDSEDCRCPPGTYVKIGECLRCGEGTNCSGWDQPAPTAAIGFMISGVFKGHGEFPVFNCFGDVQRCPGGPPGTCAKGRTGLGCSECLDGMTEGASGECEPCGDHSSAPFVIAVVVALLMFGWLYRDSVTKNLAIKHLDTLFLVSAAGVLITSLQMLSVIQLLPFEWGSPVDEILEFTKIFVVDIKVLQPNCVVDAGASAKYIMLAVLVPMCLLVFGLYHLIVMLTKGLHSIPTENLTTGLRNTCGVIFSLTFTSYMALLAGAFQCDVHPSGVSTMRKYESVVCWDSDDHTAVLAIALVFMLLPVTFLSMCVWAAIQFPSRSVRGDAAFFQNWSFLFLRFRAQCSWFSLAILARGFVLPLTSAFSNPVVHIFSMQVILLGFLGTLCTLRPWKMMYINVLDIAVNIPVVLIVGMAPFFVYMPDRTSAATLTAICCFCCLLFIPLAIVAKLVHTLLNRGKKRFQFFLCHHKDGAGYFSRLLKMQLQGNARVHREVFLDCDNLSDLTTLFGWVRDHTETLVAICSKELLWRPWCMGEIVTTHQSGV